MRYLSRDEIHAEQLKMLRVFHEFCSENGLRYSLIGGTLLGACREGGFISWDDDVDVAMPRPDFDAFCSLSNRLPDNYHLLTFANSAWPQGFAKLQFMEVRAQEPTLQGVIEEYLWIDVFPFDAASDDSRVRARTINRIQRTIRAISRRTYLPDPNDKTPKAFAKRLYHRLFGSSVAIGGLKKRLNDEFHSLDYEGSSLVCCYANGAHSADMVVEKSRFEQTEPVGFEGLYLNRSLCFDDLLRGQFGTYWVPPPIEMRRASHSYLAWRAVS